jgi:F0F1-type ATP synthase beta subunit
LVLSRAVAESGMRPAVDLLKTTSSLLTPQVVGDRHYRLAGRVQAIMEKYESLKNIIAIVGENELSPADRADYQSAKKLIEFFSQDFNVAEHLTGKPGQYFTREQTLDGIEAIVGKPDSLQEIQTNALKFGADGKSSQPAQPNKQAQSAAAAPGAPPIPASPAPAQTPQSPPQPVNKPS